MLFGLYMLKGFKRISPLWTRFLAICVIITVCQWALVVPYKAQPDESRKAARIIVNALGEKFDPGMVIHKVEFADLYLLCCYLGCRVKKIHTLKDLPAADKVVYLLSSGAPATSGQKLEKALDAILQGD